MSRSRSSATHPHPRSSKAEELDVQVYCRLCPKGNTQSTLEKSEKAILKTSGTAILLSAKIVTP